MYAGAYYDSTTGLYYMQARYYDPATGQFMSLDPERWRRPSQPYAYVDDDPVNAPDHGGTAGICGSRTIAVGVGASDNECLDRVVSGSITNPQPRAIALVSFLRVNSG